MASPVGFRTFNGSSTSLVSAAFNGGQEEDLVFVRDLFVKALTGVDAWRRPEPQPVNISVYMKTSVAKAGSTDHLTYSLNYAVITRNVTKMVESGRFKSLEDIAERVAGVVLSEGVGGQWAKIQVKKPRALLRADASEIEITRVKQLKADSTAKYEIVKVPQSVDIVRIHNLRLVTIIGVNTIERLHKQNVILGLTLYKTDDKEFGFNKKYDFRKVVELVTTHVEDSSYKTVEAFVTSVAQVICEAGVSKVTVRAEKPSALTFADAAGVEVTRTQDDFVVAESKELKPKAAEKLFPDSKDIVESVEEKRDHTVFIAFGSNIGRSLSAISASIEELKKRGVTVESTSGIYESEPMYLVDQPNFYNGVFKATTQLTPLKLLKALKEIEYETFGRVKKEQNGPRSIDLDILLYDDWVINEDTLTVPHLSMLERNFVLKPLKDVTLSSEVHPLTAEGYHSHLDQLLSTKNDDSQVQKSTVLKSVVPLPSLSAEYVCYEKEGEQEERKIVFDPNTNTVNTHLMAILNVTPDSFSDGGRFNNGTEIDLESFVAQGVKAVDAGATILDIGGMSTRPGVKEEDVSVEEELSRVVPSIRALRLKLAALARQTESVELKKRYQNVVISVDTFRSQVAEAAVDAGADVVNDISGGLLDDKMFKTVARLQVPIILGHTRKSSDRVTGTMAKYAWADEKGELQIDTDAAVVNVVRHELGKRIKAACADGIRRWQIILDPGIGFSKNLKQNMAVVRNFAVLAAKSVSHYNSSGFIANKESEKPKAKDSSDVGDVASHEENDGEATQGLPWLVGTSRKRFIKAVTGQDTKDLVFGTAATVTSLIGQGADAVRVHDVEAMADVIKMSDEIYKR